MDYEILNELKNNLYLLVSGFLFSLLSLHLFSCDSCEERIDESQLICRKSDVININYSKDGIISYKGNGVNHKERLFFRDNNYYEAYDSMLCLSLKDTVFYWEDHFGQKYKRMISKISDNEYMCYTSDVTFIDCAENMNRVLLSDGERFLSIWYYDNRFRIKKILLLTVNEYK